MQLDKERGAILAEIIGEQRSDLSRLAFADHLEEYGNQRGDLARAEFIRLQVRAAGMREGPDRKKLTERAQVILDAHRVDWEQPLAAMGASRVEWERGFPAGVTVQAATFIARGSQIIGAAPSTRVAISDLSPAQVAALAGRPHLSKLTELNLGVNAIGDEGAQALAGRPHLSNLTSLNLVGNEIGDHLLAQIEREMELRREGIGQGR